MSVLEAVKNVVLHHRYAAEPDPQRRALLIDLGIAEAAKDRARVHAVAAHREWSGCEPEIKDDQHRTFVVARDEYYAARDQVNRIKQALGIDV